MEDKVWTKEETLDYNKRCAEFIGATPCKDWQGEDGYEHSMFYHSQWSNKFQDYLELYSYRYSELQFNSDWNWIMEVVEAIEKLEVWDKEYDSEYSVNILNKCCLIDSLDYKTPVEYRYAETKKEAVVQAINQFLIWYNEQRT